MLVRCLDIVSHHNVKSALHFGINSLPKVELPSTFHNMLTQLVTQEIVV